MARKLKVFHGLVNYGTQAGLFAKALREEGIDAISVAYSDRFSRLIDVTLSHNGNLPVKILKRLRTLSWKTYWFFKYNTFHFYYGTSLLPRQLDLPFYRLFGKKVIFHYLGKDVKLYKQSIEKYEISNMAYSCGTHEEALKADNRKSRRLKYETKYADLQFVCSPVYSEFVPNSILIPLAIDLNEYTHTEKEITDELVIMHAPTSRDNKGTSFIINAIDKLLSEGHKIKFLLCENIPHNVLKQKYKECDIFIDQVLGGYGTAAIEAMAIGRPTISYLRDVHFNEITMPGGIPIIIAHRDNIYDVLKKTIENKHTLTDIGIQSRQFVERNHDVKVLTKRLINFYEKLHDI